jgi:hypothetical protein
VNGCSQRFDQSGHVILNLSRNEIALVGLDIDILSKRAM